MHASSRHSAKGYWSVHHLRLSRAAYSCVYGWVCVSHGLGKLNMVSNLLALRVGARLRFWKWEKCFRRREKKTFWPIRQILLLPHYWLVINTVVAWQQKLEYMKGWCNCWLHWTMVLCCFIPFLHSPLSLYLVQLPFNPHLCLWLFYPCTSSLPFLFHLPTPDHPPPPDVECCCQGFRTQFLWSLKRLEDT